MKFEIDESDRQIIVLGLVELSKIRPGWDSRLGKIAETLSAGQMYENFKTIEERWKLKQVEKKLDEAWKS